jgi:hypothetical protein
MSLKYSSDQDQQSDHGSWQQGKCAYLIHTDGATSARQFMFAVSLNRQRLIIDGGLTQLLEKF